MFDISITKIFFTLIVGLIVLGPKQITTIAIFLGRYWKKLTQFRDKVKDEFDDIMNETESPPSPNPTTSPTETLPNPTTNPIQENIVSTSNHANVNPVSSSSPTQANRSESGEQNINTGKPNPKTPNLSQPDLLKAEKIESVHEPVVDYPEYEIKHKIVQPMMGYHEALSAHNPKIKNKPRVTQLENIHKSPASPQSPSPSATSPSPSAKSKENQ